MKIRLILSAILAVGLCNTSLPQVIANASFENWYIQEYYEEPDTFMTSNFRTWLTGGLINVIKTSDSHSGNYAARLETIAVNDEIIGGFLIIGNASEGGITGGLPFTGRPDSLTGNIKYTTDTSQGALVLCFFKKDGVTIGSAGNLFTGSEEEYVRFALAVDWSSPDPPDSMIFIASSSDLGGSTIPGDILYIDDIGFTGTTIPFPNGTLEDWHTIFTEEPEDWTTFNAFGCFFGSLSAFKSTDSFSGNYALELHNIQMPGDQVMGFVTNGFWGDFGPAGGMPVDGNPMLLTGYYKYFPDGPDTALAGITSFYYDETGDSTVLLEQIMIKLSPSDEYTYFEIPMLYNASPLADTLNITFASGNLAGDTNYVGLNSVLYIDSLNLEYYPVSVGPEYFSEQDLKVYPNPAGDFLQIESILAMKTLRILNNLGMTVFSIEPEALKSNVDIHNLPPGMYFIEIKTEQKKLMKKIIIL
jgi:hypothetical protein